MSGESMVAVELDGDRTMVVVAETVGDTGAIAKLSAITSSIDQVSHDTLDTVRRAGPSNAIVEHAFGLAIESGQVVALFGKGRGEASVKVILEWCHDRAESPDEDREHRPPRLATADS